MRFVDDFPFGVVASWTRGWGTTHWEGSSEVPPEWAIAVAAVERDLGCWVRKKELPDLTGHEWQVLGSESAVHVQLRRRGDGGWGGFLNSSNLFELDLTVAETMAQLADEIQGDLTGNAWIDWPSAGWSVLDARVVDGVAVWMTRRDRRVVARVGNLCHDCTTPW